MNHYLHFTVSPVQPWVASARRLRDFWAGSYLLSYLSGVAMLEVSKAGGAIEYPLTKGDALFDALEQKSQGVAPAAGPIVGTLPNRFKAVIAGDEQHAAEIANQARAAFQNAWLRIAHAVWDQFLEQPSQHAKGDCKARFVEQITAFWDITYIVTLESSDLEARALERRKTWRTHAPPVQGGDHCTLMHEWSELSGYNRAWAAERDSQTKFWNAVRAAAGELNIGEAERLSGIALVKRLYPLLTNQLEVIGWDLKTPMQSWRSTSYMAAVPWLEAAMRVPEGAAYAACVRDLNGAFKGDVQTKFATDISSLTALASQYPEARLLEKLDGAFFFQSGAEHPERLPWRDGTGTQQQQLLESLKALNKKVGPASPYYALLLMDGDQMGKLLSTLGNPADLSSKLTEFASAVDGIVKKHNGKSVYAGGDDVLAVLPLTTALGCAAELRAKYLEVFKDARKEDKTVGTLSGAIVYAHYSVSLKGAMRHAHHLLDDIAKDENGRDSLAACALNGNGILWQWVSAWAYPQGSAVLNPVSVVNRLLEDFESPEFSNKFLYKIRERFAVFGHTRYGATDQIAQSHEVLQALLEAEYLKTRAELGKDDKKTPEEAARARQEVTARIADLLGLCTPHRNPAMVAPSALQADGAIMLRFLSAKGVGV